MDIIKKPVGCVSLPRIYQFSGLLTKMDGSNGELRKAGEAKSGEP